MTFLGGTPLREGPRCLRNLPKTERLSATLAVPQLPSLSPPMRLKDGSVKSFDPAVRPQVLAPAIAHALLPATGRLVAGYCRAKCIHMRGCTRLEM